MNGCEARGGGGGGGGGGGIEGWLLVPNAVWVGVNMLAHLRFLLPMVLLEFRSLRAAGLCFV